MGHSYQLPDLPSGTPIQSLAPTDLPSDQLTPDRIVRCINRGRDVLEVQFDSRHFHIEPGYFECTYAQAQHFKSHLIVPGTRDRHAHERVVSWIGILGIDRPERCTPFTDEELAFYGQQVEGLDRGTSDFEDEREVERVDLRGRASNTRHRPRTSPKGALDAQIDRQATPEAKQAAATAFKPPRASDAEREAVEHARERSRG